MEILNRMNFNGINSVWWPAFHVPLFHFQKRRCWQNHSNSFQKSGNTYYEILVLIYLIPGTKDCNTTKRSHPVSGLSSPPALTFLPAAFTSLTTDLLHVCFGLPTLLFLSIMFCRMIQSIIIRKIVGDNMHPCFTLVFIVNESVYLPMWVTCWIFVLLLNDSDELRKNPIAMHHLPNDISVHAVKSLLKVYKGWIQWGLPFDGLLYDDAEGGDVISGWTSLNGILLFLVWVSYPWHLSAYLASLCTWPCIWIIVVWSLAHSLAVFAKLTFLPVCRQLFLFPYLL